MCDYVVKGTMADYNWNVYYVFFALVEAKQIQYTTVHQELFTSFDCEYLVISAIQQYSNHNDCRPFCAGYMECLILRLTLS